jgi:hypothetical protein
MIKPVYLKSHDEHAVIHIKVKEPDTLTPWYCNHGYVKIDHAEYIHLRRRIRNKIKRLIYPVGGLVS